MTSNNNSVHDDDDEDIELGRSPSPGNIPTASAPERSGSSSSMMLDNLPVVEAQDYDSNSAATNLIVAEDVVLLDEQSIRSGHYEDPTQRPSLISVCYHKASSDMAMGISFRFINGVLQLSNIQSSSPLFQSPLRKGDTIVAIDNHRNCSRWTSTQMVRYLKSCSGHFTMLFSNALGDPDLHEAVVYKASEDEKIGIVFENNHEQRLRIKTINTWGLIGKLCALQEGDYVTYINDNASHMVGADTARIMVRSAPFMVSIRAIPTQTNDAISIRNAHELSTRGYSSYNVTQPVDATANESILANSTTDSITSSKANGGLSQSIAQPSPSDFDNFLAEEGMVPRFVYVQCRKPTIDTPLGIKFISTPGKLIISAVSGTGVLWASPLRKGYEVLAMDGQVVNKWSTAQAAQYIKNREVLSIMARNPEGSCSYVVAQVTKPTPRSKIGVTFKAFDDGRLKIGRILLKSLFAGSILNADNEILNINGVPAYGLTTPEAVEIVEHATDTVTILAKTDPSTAIVLASLGAEYAATMAPMNTLHIDAPVAQYAEDEGEQNRACNPAFVICFIIFFVVFFLVVALVGPADGNY